MPRPSSKPSNSGGENVVSGGPPRQEVHQGSGYRERPAPEQGRSQGRDETVPTHPAPERERKNTSPGKGDGMRTGGTREGRF